MNQFDANAVAPVGNNGSQHLNHGAVAIEQSRAVTEAQGKLLLAKQFPRDINEAFRNLMNSCKRKGLAGMATYSFPRGKETVSGPSIRLAEEIARLYGNIEYGIRELSNVNGESEMEAYAWDLQTNVVSSQKFKVKHERKAYGKMQQLTDTRDVYELTANMGARRLRSRLLAVLPPDLVEAAVEECRKTVTGNNEIPIADRARKMATEFEKLGVSRKMIEARLGHGIDDISAEQIADFLGIFNSIKNGQSGRNDWFEVQKDVAAITEKVTEKGDFSPVNVKKKDPVAKKEAPAKEEKQPEKEAKAEESPPASDGDFNPEDMY